MSIWRYMAAVVIISAGMWVSYGLARAGEPSSEWFWCDIIGLCTSNR